MTAAWLAAGFEPADGCSGFALRGRRALRTGWTPWASASALRARSGVLGLRVPGVVTRPGWWVSPAPASGVDDDGS